MPKKSNVQWREDGFKKAKVYLGDGKYKYFYAKTQKDLDEKVFGAKIALNKGLDLACLNNTFGEWCDVWLENKKETVSEKRYKSYSTSIKRFETFRFTDITRLHQVDIQRVFNALAKQNYAKSTLNDCKIALHGVFKLAIGNRVTDYNPMDYIIVGGKPAEKREAISLSEQKMIIETPHRAQTAAMIMLFAGLRRGEMIALTWSDIDLKNNLINVNKAAKMKDGRLEVEIGAKTDAGTRKVRIPKILSDYLASAPKETMLVCPSAKGTILSETGFKRFWESYMYELNWKYGDFDGVFTSDEKGNVKPYVKPESRYAPKKVPTVIDKFTPHMLRHTYITMLYLSGVDVMTAKEQAGHADVTTTMNIYTHLSEGHVAEEIRKLDEYIKVFA
jgi:integrase